MKQDVKSPEAKKAHEEFQEFYWGVGAAYMRDPRSPDPVLTRVASSSRSFVDFFKGLWKLRRCDD